MRAPDDLSLTKRLRSKRWLYVLLAGLSIGLMVWIVFNSGNNFFSELSSWLLKEDTSLAVFIVLLATLPVIGFPISIFCVLAGARFGIAGGLMVIGLAMAWHLLVSYLLAHSFLREWVRQKLSKADYQIPQVSKQHQLGYAVAFVALPVIPYAAKNILLALSELPWSKYFLVAWSIQMLYSYPLIVIVGAAQQQSVALFTTGLLALLIILLLARWARRIAKTSEH